MRDWALVLLLLLPPQGSASVSKQRCPGASCLPGAAPLAWVEQSTECNQGRAPQQPPHQQAWDQVGGGRLGRGQALAGSPSGGLQSPFLPRPASSREPPHMPHTERAWQGLRPLLAQVRCLVPLS